MGRGPPRTVADSSILRRASHRDMPLPPENDLYGPIWSQWTVEFPDKKPWFRYWGCLGLGGWDFSMIYGKFHFGIVIYGIRNRNNYNAL